ncbi:GntR family transcriptional regulator [Rathayibacter sp. VKM Ac-2803]|uniref:FadR/GntR family transcriptional regulator n=1 Tax=unclassified Rathayibacter TaxID=2609250 RepID=UPI00135C3105|nr:MULTISPECIES: GntR family transcriptional regulator [unclassified Rathayibacter]MWV51021.1 GntR family transcriptional regulator [Rathayibacter sp. VKM Ac-2803]MWV57509.1 GntR family transcriptional regulator [Rathayibacter sp. VKM Ac-2754]
MTFIAVQKVSAYESIVEQIERAVEAGDLKPGDRLPGERQLMADFSVSRATVREALRVLQATGILESRPGDPRGPMITAYSPRMLEKSMARLAHLESISRVELLQFRLLLEGQSCLLAAENRTAEDLALIEEHLAALHEVARGEADGFGERVNRFHAAIRHASGNQLIEVCGNVVGGVMAHLADGRLVTETDRLARMRQSAADGETLVDALRRRSPREAADISRRTIYRYYADDLTADEVRALASSIPGVVA